MKKKEWIILIIIALLSAGALFVMRIRPGNDSGQKIPGEAVNMPEEEAKGQWIAVVHRSRVILCFDSAIDAEYTVSGNVSDMVIEVRDGSWHVKDVACYDFTCKNMGWVNESSILPIICLPNDIVITDAATAENMISGGTDGS